MRIALLSAAHVRKGAQVAEALEREGVRPQLFVFEPLRRGRLGRIRALLPESPVPGSAAAWAKAKGVPALEGAAADPAFLAKLADWKPDLFVAAGAGILRRPLLALPRLGTLNGHMGLLPRYRGMNVAEWSVYEGAPVGATVHLVDAGIDTGPILATRELEELPITIAALREKMDWLQLKLLAEVTAEVVRTGALPEPRPQRREDGRQYFRMHPELRTITEARLRARAGGSSGV